MTATIGLWAWADCAHRVRAPHIFEPEAQCGYGSTVFAIWRSCQHFATPGSTPDAAGSKLEVVLAASEHLPSTGRANRFIARRTDTGQWLSVGFVANGSLIDTTTSAQLRKYERVRTGELTWSNDAYPPLTDRDHPSKTVNLDAD